MDAKTYTVEQARAIMKRKGPVCLDGAKLSATLRAYADMKEAMKEVARRLANVDTCSSRADHMQEICECHEVDAIESIARRFLDSPLPQTEGEE